MVRVGNFGGTAWRAWQRGRRAWYRVSDSRRLAEMRGERVVFAHLHRNGFLEAFHGARILEIGPKHGEDSKLLATLDPSELVLLDLPEKRELTHAWFPAVAETCPARLVETNLLYMPSDELEALGTFDLVWCLGVVYHNVEQLRLLRRLFLLTRTHGGIVIESSTTRNRRLAKLNVVELHWPRTYRDQPTMTHHPSRLALKSWLEMVGFADVRVEDAYSRATAWQRAVLTGLHPENPRPYVSYGNQGDAWIAGDAT